MAQSRARSIAISLTLLLSGFISSGPGFHHALALSSNAQRGESQLKADSCPPITIGDTEVDLCAVSPPGEPSTLDAGFDTITIDVAETTSTATAASATSTSASIAPTSLPPVATSTSVAPTSVPLATSTSVPVTLPPSTTSLPSSTAMPAGTATYVPTQTPIAGGAGEASSTATASPTSSAKAEATETASETAGVPTALVKFALPINPRTGRTAQGTIVGGRKTACPSAPALLVAIGKNAAILASAEAAGTTPSITSRFAAPIYPSGCLWLPIQVTDPALATQFTGATVVVTAKFPDGTSRVVTATMDSRGHTVAVASISYTPPAGAAHGSSKTIVALSAIVTDTSGVAQPALTTRVVAIAPPR